MSFNGNGFLNSQSQYALLYCPLGGTTFINLKLPGVLSTASVTFAVPNASLKSGLYTLGVISSVDSVGDGIPDWWRQLYFGGTGASASALSAANADADGDGLPNLLEYALGSNPTDASSRGLVSVTTADSPSYLTLTFVRARSNLTYVVEATSDLKSWSPIATNPGGVGQTVTVTDTVSINDANTPRRFLRLRVFSP